MSVVLVIDEKADKIKKQFLPMKGIFCDSALSISEATKLLELKQYDFVLIDFELSPETRITFYKSCKDLQPNSTFHYIVNFDKEQEDGGLDDEVSLADSYVRRPVGHDNMFELLEGENLVDQSDIDNLFANL